MSSTNYVGGNAAARIMFRLPHCLSSFDVPRFLTVPALLFVLLVSGCATPAAHRTFDKSVLLNPTEASFVRDVPIYPRKQRHAAVASLAMVTRHWKSSRATYKLYRAFEANSVDSSLYELLDEFMVESKLWFHLTSGTRKSLRERVSHGVPMIVFLQDEPLNPATLRTVVVVGYDNATYRYLCHDGGEKPVVYGYSDFHNKWRAARRIMLQVSPHDFPNWPLTFEEYVSRAKSHAKNDNLDLAVRDYESARAIDTNDTTLVVNLGDLHRLRGKPEKAELLYRQAIALEPSDYRVYNNLAYVLAEQAKSLDEAVQLSKKAAAQQPDNPLFLDTLGYALSQSGRREAASDVFEKARVRALKMPANVQIRIALHQARNYQRNGNVRFAEQAIQDVIKLGGREDIPAELRYLTE